MLASVTGPAEADLVIAGGADIVDLKPSGRGAPAAVIRRTVAAVAGRRSVSVALGNLPMQPQPVHDAVADLAETGVDTIRLGCLPGGDLPARIRAAAAFAGKVKLMAVLFADHAPDLALLPLLAELGFAGAMLDTANKADGHLLAHMDVPQLRHFVLTCRAQGLVCGLAGALEAPDVPRLLVLEPGWLGFRGALCGGNGRAAAIDPAAVREIRALIPPESRRGATGTDCRLLAARGYAPDMTADATGTDLVFVRDLVLPVRIGAYARERAAPQRVRFAVEVTIVRAARPTQDMRDVFSYDIISDGIRMLVERGHVALVETLAEQIAAMLLAHQRVRKVAVRLEKLDAGPGIVGVAIERSRADAVPGPALP
jgi:dihydroneopterin aldolase